VCTVKETSVNLNKFFAGLCLRINWTEASVNFESVPHDVVPENKFDRAICELNSIHHEVVP